MYRVLVYRRKYLPASETFIYEQLIGHQNVKPVVLTRNKPINLRQFPYDEIYVKRHFQGMTKWLKQKKISCLHARFGPAGVDLLHIAKRSRLPLLTSFHGSDITKQIRVNPSYRRSLKRLFRQGAAFTVVSNHMKKKLVRHGCPNRKITLLRSGIDLGKFPIVPPRSLVDNEIRFLSVGRLVEKKGMDTLIRAFKRVHAKYPKATLTIVGDGEEKVKLKRLIRTLKLQKVVTLKGALTHSSVQNEMESCHVFVIACKTGRDGNQEGIPNVLMEAMATGRPVISTYHAGIPELVSHKKSGYLVPERSPITLGNMMNRVVSQHNEWPTIVQNAREKVVKQHNIRNQRLKLENLYLQLIKKKK